MKVTPFAQSSTSISVTWSYDAGDETPASVTIREFGPDGSQMAAQALLPPVGGLALFTGLKPSTSYKYQWCGVFPSTAGDLTSCADPVTGTTSPAPKAPSAPGAGGGSPPGNPTPARSGGVMNLQAQARPFGKVAIAWAGGANSSDATLVQTDLSIGHFEIVLPSSRGKATGQGPFVVGHNYEFRANGYDADSAVRYSDACTLVYPGWLGLKPFLPAGFDASMGIKRLRPDDRPFVSVRSIMSAA